MNNEWTIIKAFECCRDSLEQVVFDATRIKSCFLLDLQLSSLHSFFNVCQTDDVTLIRPWISTKDKINKLMFFCLLASASRCC